MSGRRATSIAALPAVAALLLGLAGCVAGPGDPTATVTNADGSTGFPTPSMAPPTSAPQTPEPTMEPEPTASGIEAVITVAGTDADVTLVSASGYVAGVVEDGGTCTYTFTDGSAQIEQQREGVANVSTTACGLVDVPYSEFSAAAWTVTLTYTSSAAGTVTSTPVPVEKP